MGNPTTCLDDVVQLAAHHLPFKYTALCIRQRALQLRHLRLQLTDLRRWLTSGSRNF